MMTEKKQIIIVYYKYGILILSLIFLFISFYNFFYTISIPTDENIFTDPPSKFYVVREINCQKTKEQANIGDFLLKINNISIDSIQINRYLFDFNDTSTIKLSIYNPVKDQLKEIYTKKADLKETFVIKLNSAVYVLSVLPGGASDRAGLKSGDIITKINNKEFRNANDADEIMRKAKKTSIEYEIVRNGQTYKLEIELAKFGISFILLIYFLTGLLFIITGFVIGYLRSEFFAARLIGLAFPLIGFAITGKLNPYLTIDLEKNIVFLIILISANSTGIIGLAMFIHSFIYFPIDISFLKQKNKRLIIALYIFSIVFSVLFIIPILNKNINQTLIINLSTYGIALSYLLIIFLILRKIKQAELSSQIKSIGKPIFYSILVNILVLFLMPIIIYFQLTYLIYLNLLLLLIPLSYIYTIGKYRLFNLDLRIRKNNQYIISVLLLRLAIAVVFFAFVWFVSHLNLNYPNLHFTGTSIEVLEKPLSSENRAFYNTFLSIILSLTFLRLLFFIYKKSMFYINKKFYRTNLDYKKIAVDINKILKDDISVEKYIETISNIIKENLLLNKVCIILFDDFKLGCPTEVSDVAKKLILTNLENIKEIFGKDENIFRVEYLPPELKKIFVEYGFTSILPIRHKDKLYGIACLGEKLSETPIDSEDFHLVLSFLNQSVIILENIKLYQDLAARERMKHELELARRIQISSLPQNLPKLENLKIAAKTIPAFEVGGDFYDFINLKENGVTVIIGDVSGKGASAALYMSKVQGIIRTLSEFDLSPKELLCKTNKLLYNHIEKNAFISVLIAKIYQNENKIVVARAGHLPLFVYSNTERRVLELKPKGIILGATSDEFFTSNIEETELYYNKDDIFIFVSDGAIETRNENDEFGIERLKALIAHFKYLEPEDLIEQILIEIYRFSGKKYFDDDLTIVAIKAC